MKRSLIVLPLAAVLALSACSTTSADAVLSGASTGASAGAAGASSAAPEYTEEPSAEPTEEEDGVAAFGQTYTWTDGLEVTITDEGKYTKSQYAIGKGKAFREFKIVVTNHTGQVYEPSSASVSVSSGDEEGDEVFDSAKGMNGRPDTKVRDGKKVSYRVAFGVQDPADLTVEFAPDYDHESVLFSNS